MPLYDPSPSPTLPTGTAARNDRKPRCRQEAQGGRRRQLQLSDTTLERDESLAGSGPIQTCPAHAAVAFFSATEPVEKHWATRNEAAGGCWVTGGVCDQATAMPARRVSASRLRRHHHPQLRPDLATSMTTEPVTRATWACALESGSARVGCGSRPPRQRLPSSLVIEGVSASASACSSRYVRRDTSDER